MPRCVNCVPKHRLHRASGQAVVTIAGRDTYLGPWKSAASRLEYEGLIGEWVAVGRPSHAAPAVSTSLRWPQRHQGPPPSLPDSSKTAHC